MRPQQQANVEAQRHERTVRAVELRKQDMTYREIARELGVDVATAYEDVWRHYEHLEKIATEKLEKIRAKELRDLATWEASLADMCEMGSAKAVLACLKIKERRAKLLGLDAPTKVETKNVTDVPEEEFLARAKKAIKAIEERKKGEMH